MAEVRGSLLSRDIWANCERTTIRLVATPVMLIGMDFMKPAEELLAQVAARFGSAEAFLEKLAQAHAARRDDDTIELPRIVGGLPNGY